MLNLPQPTNLVKLIQQDLKDTEAKIAEIDARLELLKKFRSTLAYLLTLSGQPKAVPKSSLQDREVMERIKAWMSPDVWERLVRAIVHDQCHNLGPIVGPKEFAAGCTEYQRKMFGDIKSQQEFDHG